MNFSFHPSAKEELNQAIEYYEESREGLGLKFLEEIYLAIQHIIQFPTAWTKLSKNTHRCITN